LYHRKLTAERPNFIAGSPPEQKQVLAKIRYNAPKVPARLEVHNSTVEVEFAEPQKSITPGQAVVFYDQDIVLGGATITAYGD